MSEYSNTYPIDNGYKKKVKAGVTSSTYGLAFIGALVYYIQHAATFGAGLFGFFKALFWPAVLIYNLMEHLKM